MSKSLILQLGDKTLTILQEDTPSGRGLGLPRVSIKLRQEPGPATGHVVNEVLYDLSDPEDRRQISLFFEGLRS